jgi:hydroxymethylpyrimidine pyrophosphatase-like HAD family hydrolase
MGNAEPAVREICAYVTAPVEQDGIARALRHFHLSEP